MLPAQRLLLLGRSGLVSAATSVLGTTPYHYWDFLNNRALFNSVDVGGVTSTPGWSFTRASTGYANQTPNPEFGSTNLALRSQDWSVSPWTTIVGGTSTANAGTAPDGTATATRFTFSAQYSVRGQNITTTDGTTYVWSFWAKLESGNTALTFFHDQSASGNYNATPFTVTTTWTRYSITCLGRTGGGLVVAGIQDRNASGQGSVLVWGAQIEPGSTATTYKPTTTVAVTDVSGPPLVSFGSGVLRRTSKGALIEGAGTNLVLRSQEFGDAAWAVAGLNAVTSDVIAAPDGTTTADKITENSATSSHYHRPAANITISNATAYTFSIYAKAAERRYVWVLGDAEGGLIGATPAVFDLQAGTVINAGSTTASIQALAGGWYRLIVTATSTGVTARPGIGLRATSGSGVESYAGDGASGCYLWGAQLEAQGWASSYVPTTTASATRAADVLTVSSPGVTYPLSLFAEFEQPALANSTQYVLSTAGASDIGTESASLYSDLNSKPAWIVFAGSANQGNSAAASAMTAGVAVKSALRVNTNDARFASSATLLAADTVLTLPTAPTQVRFGSSSGGNMYLRRAAVFSSALSDAQLQRAST